MPELHKSTIFFTAPPFQAQRNNVEAHAILDDFTIGPMRFELHAGSFRSQLRQEPTNLIRQHPLPRKHLIERRHLDRIAIRIGMQVNFTAVRTRDEQPVLTGSATRSDNVDHSAFDNRHGHVAAFTASRAEPTAPRPLPAHRNTQARPSAARQIGKQPRPVR